MAYASTSAPSANKEISFLGTEVRSVMFTMNRTLVLSKFLIKDHDGLKSRLAIFVVVKGSDRKYFRLCGHTVFVFTTNFCHYSVDAARNDA